MQNAPEMSSETSPKSDAWETMQTKRRPESPKRTNTSQCQEGSTRLTAGRTRQAF